MDKQLPKRKPMRLQQYDYSSAGVYFITICIQDRRPILSDILLPSDIARSSVGDGAFDVPPSDIARPSVGDGAFDVPPSDIACPSVGDGAFDVPQIRLTEIGKIIEKNLLSSEKIPGVKIDRYVIMPDHIHAIILLDSAENTKRQSKTTFDGASKYPNGTSRAPSPTNYRLPHILSTFKRFCNKEIGSNIFQRGYSEHIIRDQEDYETRLKYMNENPIRWYYKK